MLALALGIAPNLPGFLNAIGAMKASPVSIAIYDWAWFVGFGVAAITYRIGMRAAARDAQVRMHASL